jgi:MFS superfamily sulfate permease-like transporter
MHDCYYQLGIIDHDTLTSFLRFCVQFWMGHYRMKKQQFDMSQREVEEEKKKLDAIIAEKEAWEKWDNSTPRVLEKTIKKLEEMGEQLEKEFAATSLSSSSQQPQQPKPKQQRSVIDNLSLEDMMA